LRASGVDLIERSPDRWWWCISSSVYAGTPFRGEMKGLIKKARCPHCRDKNSTHAASQRKPSCPALVGSHSLRYDLTQLDIAHALLEVGIQVSTRASTHNQGCEHGSILVPRTGGVLTTPSCLPVRKRALKRPTGAYVVSLLLLIVSLFSSLSRYCDF
jgi:hypothetical protein